MTQTLDRAPQTDGPIASVKARAAGAPATPAGETASAVFAITYGIAFALLYTVFERLNWPLFTYHPVSGIVDFGRQPAGVGPPMFWYGWIVLAAAAALPVAWAATRVPARVLHRATVFSCALAVLWPAVLAALRIFIADWATFDADFLNAPWVAAGPAAVGAAVVTWLVGARPAERLWTSFLLVVPITGLIVLGYSLQQFFVR
jgi:hypothetical protein